METIIDADFCRICLTYAPDGPQIAEVLFQNFFVAKIILREDDPPKKLCCTCFTFLKELENFEKTLQNTEQTLLDLRNTQLQPKVELKLKDDAENFVEFEPLPTPPVYEIEPSADDIEPKKLTNYRPKRHYINGFEYYLLEEYLLENLLNMGPQEGLILKYKQPVERISLPDTSDKRKIEFSVRYSCEYCQSLITGSQLSGIDLLAQHIKKNHHSDEITSITCSCQLVFSSRVIFEHHRQYSPVCFGEEVSTQLQDIIHCTFCYTSSPYIKSGVESIRRHTVHHHATRQLFLCPCCDYTTFNLDMLRVHYKVRNHRNNFPICQQLRCNFCQFECCLESNLQLHVVNCHEQSQLDSCVCGEKFWCDDLAIQHILFRCLNSPDHLLLPFRSLFSSKTMSDSKIKPTKRVCEECGIEISIAKYGYHMEKHEAAGQRYSCDLCGRSYGVKLNLKLHMRKIHLKNMFFTCKECGRKFRDWSAMNYHYRTIHDRSKLLHTCDTCGKQFAGLYRLETHRTVHTGVKKYQCDLCELTFRHKNQLKQHRSVHTSERPLDCPTCGKAFKDKKGLKQHSRTHEERSFVCPICEMSFTVGHTLRTHVTTQHPDFPMPPPGTPLRNVDLKKYITPEGLDFILKKQL